MDDPDRYDESNCDPARPQRLALGNQGRGGSGRSLRERAESGLEAYASPTGSAYSAESLSVLSAETGSFSSQWSPLQSNDSFSTSGASFSSRKRSRHVRGFLPALLDLGYALEYDSRGNLVPHLQQLEGCCLFVDICNYSSVSDQLAVLDSHRGAERVAIFLNSCFSQVVRLVSKSGGDVIRYAGDGIIVLFPVDRVCSASLDTAAQRAVQCGLDIQETLDSVQLFEDIAWSFKIGVGVGSCALLHLGGSKRYERREFVAVGDALSQAFQAEQRASRHHGGVICSPETMELVADLFDWTPLEEGSNRSSSSSRKEGDEEALPPPPPLATARFGLITGHKVRIKKKKNITTTTTTTLRRAGFSFSSAASDVSDSLSAADMYLPEEVYGHLNEHGGTISSDPTKDWTSELRHCTVLFIHLDFPIKELCALSGADSRARSSSSSDKAALNRLNRAVVEIQNAIYDYEGFLNKINLDDKGITAIAAFGLAAKAHEDDAARSVLSALRVVSTLSNSSLQVPTSIGITSGVCFCGVVGHCGGRKEFTLIGDAVNLAARLMQCATASYAARVLTDESTRRLVRDVVEFSKEEHKITVKGKLSLIKVFLPSLLKQAQGDTAIRRWRAAALTAAVSGLKESSDWAKEWEGQVSRYAPRAMETFRAFRIDSIHEAVVGGTADTALSIAKRTPCPEQVVTFVAGETGAGKSHFLATLWHTASGRPSSTGSFLIYATVGNPFQKGKLARTFGVWVDLVQQCYVEQFQNKYESTAPSIHQALSEWLCKARTRLEEDAHLLNDLFGTHFPSPDDSGGDYQALLAEGIVWKRACLLADLLTGMALHCQSRSPEKRRLLCLIDDVHHMDADSWAVLERLADLQQGKDLTDHLCVVITCKPLVGDATWVSHALAIQAANSEGVTVEELPALDFDHVAALISRKLVVPRDSIPEDLVRVIELASLGNPLFAIEQLAQVREKGLLRVDPEMQRCCWTPNEKLMQYLKTLRNAAAAQDAQTSFSTKKLSESFQRINSGLPLVTTTAMTGTRLAILGVKAMLEKFIAERYERFRKFELVAATKRRRQNKTKALSSFASSQEFRSSNLLRALAIQPPPSLCRILSEWICELSPLQRFLLQVASVAMKEDRDQCVFQKVIVRRTVQLINPDVTPRRFESDFDKLCELNFLRQVETEAAEALRSDTKSEETRRTFNSAFKFVRPFVAHLLQLGMLQAQTQEIERCLADAQELHEQDVRRRFMSKSRFKFDFFSVPMKEGMVLVQKQKAVDKQHGGRLRLRRHSLGSIWKRRFACVYTNRVEFFTDASKTRLKGTAFLGRAHVMAESRSIANRSFVLRLDIQRWEKPPFATKKNRADDGGGETARPLFISPCLQTQEELDDWAYKLSFAIESGNVDGGAASPGSPEQPFQNQASPLNGTTSGIRAYRRYSFSGSPRSNTEGMR